MEWQAIAGTASVLSAIAGAVSAISSWRAASASRRTSRDALEALAVGLRPKVQSRIATVVQGGPDGLQATSYLTATLKNLSDHDAADIEVEARLTGGAVLRGETAWLRPSRFRTWKHHDEQNDTRISLAEESWDGEIERTIVRFSDSRRIARYEREERHMVQQHGPNPQGITGETRWTQVREDRIDGP